MSFVQLSGKSWGGTEAVERFIKIIFNEIITNEIVVYILSNYLRTRK